jgi:hypothetical protein
MSTEQGSTIPAPPLPKCPHCKEDLTAINGFPYMLGNFTVLSVSCSACRMALLFQIFQNPNRMPMDIENPDLWRPS